MKRFHLFLSVLLIFALVFPPSTFAGFGHRSSDAPLASASTIETTTFLVTPRASDTPTPNPELYTGEQFDPNLGFYYLRARYTNPDSGRFWTMDSYEGDGEDPASLHKYLYCHVNPVNGLDPSGHMNLVEVQSTVSGQVQLAQTVLRVGRVLDKLTTARDALILVRDLAQFFLEPGSSALNQALSQLQGTTTDSTFARFFTLDGLSEAVSTLGENAGMIAGGLATRPAVAANVSSTLAKPGSDVVIFMPTPAVGNGLSLPPITTPITFRGHNVVLFFGKGLDTPKDPMGNKITGGRVLGLGVRESSSAVPYQVFRMDWHEKHEGKYDWDDGDYHFHLPKL